MAIIKFRGEDRRDAIINHFSLDIIEEDDFFSFIEEMGYSMDADDYIIESLYKMFLELQN